MTIPPTPRPRPVLLCILDGWGCAGGGSDNAIALAKKPVWDRLMRTSPHAVADAVGAACRAAVGPDGQFRGRPHESRRRPGGDAGPAADRHRLRRTADSARCRRWRTSSPLEGIGGTCHLHGPAVAGRRAFAPGPHRGPRRLSPPPAFPSRIHAFLDGRDTPPRSAAAASCATFLTDSPAAPAFASPRSAAATTRWTATSAGSGSRSPIDAWSTPRASTRADPLAADRRPPMREDNRRVRPADRDRRLCRACRTATACCCANFRADRVRADPGGAARPRLQGLRRGRTPSASPPRRHDRVFDRTQRPFMTALFPPEELSQLLGEVVADAGLNQLRMAETEKYAARHLLLQRRRGEGSIPARSASWCPRPRSRPTTCSRRCRPPELTDKAGRGDRDAASSTSSCSTSPTPTWSAIPAILAAAIKAVETVDQLPRPARRRGQQARAASCWSPPTTATAR